MFSKILGKLKKDSTDENHKLIEKISKMNLTDMKSYINNKMDDFPVDEDGLSEVLHKLLKIDDKTSKRYIEFDDMDSKIKKGFDLILAILKNKKVTVVTIELVNEFLENSRDIIQKYDNDHKEIYCTRFKDSISLAADAMNQRTELQRKMDLTK